MMFWRGNELLFLVLIVFFALKNGKAQQSKAFPDLVFNNCYKFNFKTADSLVDQFEINYGNSLDHELLASTVLWWKIISGNDNKLNRENYYKGLINAEKKLSLEKQKNYDYYYKGITIYGYLARIDALNKNYLKAFFRINNCLKFLQPSFGKENEYNLFYLSSGLYNYYMVNAAKTYPVISPYLYLYPRGDLGKGFKFLETASNNSNKLLSTEANYFLMKIYLEEKKHDEAIIYAAKLNNDYPSNCLFLYYNFYTLLQLKNLDAAKNILKKIYFHSENNKQLAPEQKRHFINMAENELKKYFLEAGNKK